MIFFAILLFFHTHSLKSVVGKQKLAKSCKIRTWRLIWELKWNDVAAFLRTLDNLLESIWLDWTDDWGGDWLGLDLIWITWTLGQFLSSAQIGGYEVFPQCMPNVLIMHTLPAVTKLDWLLTKKTAAVRAGWKMPWSTYFPSAAGADSLCMAAGSAFTACAKLQHQLETGFVVRSFPVRFDAACHLEFILRNVSPGENGERMYWWCEGFWIGLGTTRDRIARLLKPPANNDFSWPDRSTS